MMDLHEIVMKLVGPVGATGDHGQDQRRIKNLRSLTGLVDKLVFEVDRASAYASRHEASMKAIGEHASDFLCQLSEALEDHVEARKGNE